MIKRIFRDDFGLWGHIHNQQQNQKWKILPMYFIPHGGGIMNLTNVIEYKLPQQPAKIQKRMMAAPAPELQPVSLEKGNDPLLSCSPLVLSKATIPLLQIRLRRPKERKTTHHLPGEQTSILAPLTKNRKRSKKLQRSSSFLSNHSRKKTSERRRLLQTQRLRAMRMIGNVK
jgi:hypothetical protein